VARGASLRIEKKRNASKNPARWPGLSLAGARGIEPRSRVLETLILAVVLCPLEYVNFINHGRNHGKILLHTTVFTSLCHLSTL
jgi:hypothetical protein